MKFLARPTYVRYELVDLYNQAFDEFLKHQPASTQLMPCASHTRVDSSISAQEQILFETLNKTRSQISQLSKELDT